MLGLFVLPAPPTGVSQRHDDDALPRDSVTPAAVCCRYAVYCCCHATGHGPLRGHVRAAPQRPGVADQRPQPDPVHHCQVGAVARDGAWVQLM